MPFSGGVLPGYGRLCRTAITAAAFFLAVALATAAQAQDFGSAASDDDSALELDFRLGGMWPGDADQTRPSFGARMALYLWSGPQARRFSIQATGDYRALGAHGVVYDNDPDLMRARRSLFALGTSVGYDAVRTDRFVVDVRGGVVLTRDKTTIETRTRAGSSVGEDLWEPVCHFQGFSADCRADYQTRPAISVGARRYFGGLGDYYAGLDFTRIGNDGNILVGSFGVRLR
jgi:hypothetical protein